MSKHHNYRSKTLKLEGGKFERLRTVLIIRRDWHRVQAKDTYQKRDRLMHATLANELQTILDEALIGYRSSSQISFNALFKKTESQQA